MYKRKVYGQRSFGGNQRQKMVSIRNIGEKKESSLYYIFWYLYKNAGVPLGDFVAK